MSSNGKTNSPHQDFNFNVRRILPRLPFPLTLVALLLTLPFVADAQTQAQELLKRALQLADLYNWADAGPLFGEAEVMFEATGDERSALHAKLGKLRSNIERQDQTLPIVSAELAAELADNPILQSDKAIRMFALIIKGDIDTETNTSAMRSDWEQVAALASLLGDRKWEYRALAQLGVAAFYNGDLETARRNVGSALASATETGDTSSQIRFLTLLANGLVESRMFDQALPYLERALGLAATIPDAGYQFTIQEIRLDALIGLGRLDAAQSLTDDVFLHARQSRRDAHEATALAYRALIQRARRDLPKALSMLDGAMERAEFAGLTRLLAKTQALASETYRENGNLERAEHFAFLAVSTTQASGDIWAVPLRLDTLARLHIARGRYQEAEQAFDRAGALIDSSIGSMSSVLEKTALIKASSEMYSRHFALIADHFNDPIKAYSIVEQVRGRTATDLIIAGSRVSPGAEQTERTIAALRIKLMAARSTDDVKHLRDQIFTVEQKRWVTPGVSILKARSSESVQITDVQRQLTPSDVILEYVVADPSSYCLVITKKHLRIVHLASKQRIGRLVEAYLERVNARQMASTEAKNLFGALLSPINEIARGSVLLVVRDGPLHLVPFDAFQDATGRYVAETQIVAYVPSASTYYLLAHQAPPKKPNTLLAVGGVPYARSQINKSGLMRGYERTGFSDLPSSTDEVRMVASAVPNVQRTLLVGTDATESAFKRSDLSKFDLIHFAVHAVADKITPDRAALIMLSDAQAGEDGFLQASEVTQLRLNANLVVLSACDTAVGALQGQEGIANLSRAFLLAGARNVISTLWPVEDDVSLYLMKRFYFHFSMNKAPAEALTAAKRDMLRTYRQRALPYQWAGFTIEGASRGYSPLSE